MPTSNDGAAWEARYAEGRTAWDRGGVSPALTQWLASEELAGRHVLVPGCGFGHEVPALVRAGCRVTALDIAEAPVLQLRRALAAEGFDQDRARVLQADVLNWRADAAVDAIYEQTCLCALEPEHRARYEEQLAAWLRPGGALFALFMQTGAEGGPPYDCALDDMRALFGAARWDWPPDERLRVPHPSGFEEHAYLLTKRS